MNKLDAVKRAQILHLLCEGSSMNAAAQIADVSANAVAKLLEEAGKACEAFHDETVQNVRPKRVQCDELWSFVTPRQRTSRPPSGNSSWIGWKASPTSTHSAVFPAIASKRWSETAPAQFSIRINDQYRICFQWPDGALGPNNVEIPDDR